MTIPSLRATLAGLAVFGGFGGFAASAQGQVPGAPAAPVPATPRVVKWPGGYMVLDGPEVIVRSSGTGGSMNVVTGSGNGVGNRVVVGGGAGGVTLVRNARNGIGNQLIVGADDLLLDIDALVAGLKPVHPKPAPVVPPKVAPADSAIPPAAEPAPAPIAPPSYKGKASPFWTKKAFSDAHDCNLYWCPTTKLWFRYGAEDDTYRPVATPPPAPVDEK